MERPKNLKEKEKLAKKLQQESLDQQAIEIITERPNGRVRIQKDFSHVPSMTDQSAIDENNVTKLMEKYTPDELAMYLIAKNGNRQPLLGHDFTQEPTSLQEAKNASLFIKENFNNLPWQVRREFDNPVEFLKYASNEKNSKQLEQWGLIQPQKETLNASNANEVLKAVVSPPQPPQDAKQS